MNLCFSRTSASAGALLFCSVFVCLCPEQPARVQHTLYSPQWSQPAVGRLSLHPRADLWQPLANFGPCARPCSNRERFVRSPNLAASPHTASPTLARCFPRRRTWPLLHATVCPHNCSLRFVARTSSARVSQPGPPPRCWARSCARAKHNLRPTPHTRPPTSSYLSHPKLHQDRPPRSVHLSGRNSAAPLPLPLLLPLG